MRRSLFALGIAALIAFVGALVMLETHVDPASEDASKGASTPDAEAVRPAPAPTNPQHLRAADEPPSTPVGFKLGKTSGPDARAKAQAILDDALVELRRLDASHQELARDVYMRAHSAAERVEDELDDDDEPGRAALRAHEDALKAELRRIYAVDEPTARP